MCGNTSVRNSMGSSSHSTLTIRSFFLKSLYSSYGIQRELSADDANLSNLNCKAKKASPSVHASLEKHEETSRPLVLESLSCGALAPSRSPQRRPWEAPQQARVRSGRAERLTHMARLSPSHIPTQRPSLPASDVAACGWLGAAQRGEGRKKMSCDGHRLLKRRPTDVAPRAPVVSAFSRTHANGRWIRVDKRIVVSRSVLHRRKYRRRPNARQFVGDCL